VILGARNVLTPNEIMLATKLTTHMVRSNMIVRIGSHGVVNEAVQNGILNGIQCPDSQDPSK